MDITFILNALVTLFAAIITAFIVPWLKNKLTEQQRHELMELIKIAVKAADQLLYEQDGVARQSYVNNFLSECNYDTNSPLIKSAIESAVLELHSEKAFVAGLNPRSSIPEGLLDGIGN